MGQCATARIVVDRSSGRVALMIGVRSWSYDGEVASGLLAALQQAADELGEAVVDGDGWIPQLFVLAHQHMSATARMRIAGGFKPLAPAP